MISQANQKDEPKTASKKQQSNEEPDVPNVFNMKPGSKGRNFESFTGYRMEPGALSDQEPKRVLVKLYKRQQQAKIDEAEN
jgi:hypothetical protein